MQPSAQAGRRNGFGNHAASAWFPILTVSRTRGQNTLMKRLIAFDLDGTLAESKQAIDPDMASLLGRLTNAYDVAVMSGGDWPQFEAQLVGQLPTGTDLARLFLLPTSGTKLYRHAGKWQPIYADALTADERATVIRSLDTVIEKLDLDSAQSWGPRIEDRGTQVTFSALGQQAPVDAKHAWDPDMSRRKQIQALLTPLLPGFEVRTGGSTSIDITREGVDKGTGITRLSQEIGVPLSTMLFMGDALYPGGNDYAVTEVGVDAILVSDIEDTRKIIQTILLMTQ
jgi:phosphomannomutase